MDYDLVNDKSDLQKIEIYFRQFLTLTLFEELLPKLNIIGIKSYCSLFYLNYHHDLE